MVVTAVIGLIERQGKKRKSAPAPKVRQAATRPAAVKPARQAPPRRTPKVSPEAQSHSHAAPAPKAQAPAAFLDNEEGARVTADTPAPVRAVACRPALKPLDRDGLRNAVIWGEILKPKF